ncbi:MAG: uroporphyrin-III C-methyltransferase [Alphaproteobacteria bacterium]|jgi:uroporphyrin-III C-methyltransferase
MKAPNTPAAPASLALADLEPGWVWLIGAGPGDPGLLTLLAARALAQADVVVYDALVDLRILTFARNGAELILAGKRGGRPSANQDDISRKLIELAGRGFRVARLKGGDPCLFGRGGEEALALARARVPFRIVPGVTAGIGGLAYAGIPATHRDTGTAITFITGHTAGGDVPGDLDWAALARGSAALVFYMALGHLGRIATQLIAAGRADNEPVAVISKATTPDQKVLVTTLAEAEQAAKAGRLAPPALVVVGQIVRFRDELTWFEKIVDHTNTDNGS